MKKFLFFSYFLCKIPNFFPIFWDREFLFSYFFWPFLLLDSLGVWNSFNDTNTKSILAVKVSNHNCVVKFSVLGVGTAGGYINIRIIRMIICMAYGVQNLEVSPECIEFSWNNYQFKLGVKIEIYSKQLLIIMERIVDDRSIFDNDRTVVHFNVQRVNVRLHNHLKSKVAKWVNVFPTRDLNHYPSWASAHWND